MPGMSWADVDALPIEIKDVWIAELNKKTNGH